MTVKKKANGKYDYTANADRHDGEFTISVKDAADGSILIACFSVDKDVITGTSGELIRLPIEVASTVTTSQQGSLKNINFTDVNAQAHTIPNVTFAMTMAGGEPVVGSDEVIVSAPDVAITSGGSANLVINMQTTLTNLTAYQMSIYLPEGVTVKKKDNGKYDYTANAERHDGEFTISVKDAADGSILIACFSVDKDVIKGTSGELIRLPIEVASTVTTSLLGSIRNMNFTDVNAQAYNPTDVTLTFNYGENTSTEIEVTDISQLDNAVYIEPFTARAGEEVQLVINLKNAEEVSAYIFDMELPEGVTVATNSNGKYIDALSDRHDDHSRTINYKGNNVYSLSALSTNSEVLTGNDGPIRFLTLLVADDMEEGVYAINIRNASYSRPNGSLVEMENTTSTITLEDYLLGDVNGNNGIDIGDAVSIVNYLVGKPNQNFIEKAADTNKNGKTDIGDAVTIVNYLVGKTESLAPQLILEEEVSNLRDPE